MSAGALWLSRTRQSMAAWHASTTDGRSTRSSGGYPMTRELGQHDEIGAAGGRLVARAPDAREVAVDVANCGIELRERDGELHGQVCLVADHATIESRA